MRRRLRRPKRNRIATWIVSANLGTIANEWMRADPVGGAPWPTYNVQALGVQFGFTNSLTTGTMLMQARTFKLSVNDGHLSGFADVRVQYPRRQLHGAGITSCFVNYFTGDYQVTFSSPPAANAVITASWTQIVSPDRPAQNIDWVGNGDPQSGAVSSLLSKAPGGVNGHVFSGGQSDAPILKAMGYNFAAPGYTQMVSWLYNTRFGGLPGQHNNDPSFALKTGVLRGRSSSRVRSTLPSSSRSWLSGPMTLA